MISAMKLITGYQAFFPPLLHGDMCKERAAAQQGGSEFESQPDNIARVFNFPEPGTGAQLLIAFNGCQLVTRSDPSKKRCHRNTLHAATGHVEIQGRYLEQSPGLSRASR